MSKVYLVGSGPGTLDLYTIKAMRLVQSCDCIIYDSLIDNHILDYCKDDCMKIFAGKRAGTHYLDQEQINDLIVECSKQYEKIVRLKGGDVYVFGRGGEEGLRLQKEGIDFEVVPGVSSALAGPAYAGIPLTHRGLARGFQVVTPSMQNNGEETIDYMRYLNDDMTYVFLMGRAKLPYIIKRLLAIEKDHQTPVALISNATLPSQQTITGTLKNILDKFNENPIPAPMLIVVGKVVSLKEKLDFYENKPLFHQKLLVTSVGQDHTLKQLLDESGADITEVMTGEIQYLNNPLPDLSLYDGIIMTSQNGVHAFMQQYFKQYDDIRQLFGIDFIVIGKKTANALKQYGIKASYISKGNSENMNIELSSLPYQRYLIVQLKDIQSIHKLHNNDTYYDAYENIETDIAITGHYNMTFFTCASSVKRLSHTSVTFDKAISIGPKTTEMLRICYPNCCIKETNKPDKKLMVRLALEDHA
ncbi:MAG: uroporphyrinogen-III C-methyltransferase [Erysipelotrichaceae bacterium]|nr:uroporphyrinogen-III C-methyltransferase [Erysipelotrichaceae bacterium]